MLGVALDQGFDEGGFSNLEAQSAGRIKYTHRDISYAWRANDDDDQRGWILGESIHQRSVKAFFFDLAIASVTHVP